MYNLQGRRKWLLWLLGGILLCGMLSFLYKTEYSNSTGKVLNIYCWDTSFRTLLENYYPAYDKEKQCIGDVQVHWVIVPNTDNIYQTTVDKALFESEDKAPDQRIDHLACLVERAQDHRVARNVGILAKLHRPHTVVLTSVFALCLIKRR